MFLYFCIIFHNLRLKIELKNGSDKKMSKEQIVMAFVATCIETTARQQNTTYDEIYRRMNRVGMIENYIVPNYEPLHGESREVLAERLMECLEVWEERRCVISS